MCANYTEPKSLPGPQGSDWGPILCCLLRVAQLHLASLQQPMPGGRIRPPACVAVTGSAPGSLPSSFHQQKPQNCLARALYSEHSWAERRRGQQLCFVPPSQSLSHTCTHTCNTGNRPRLICDPHNPHTLLLRYDSRSVQTSQTTLCAWRKTAAWLTSGGLGSGVGPLQR